MKIAVVHDWLVTYAGSERALEQILRLYPEADLYSLVDFVPAGQRSFLLGKQVKTSFIQSLPFARKKYRSYLPLMPYAIEQFDLYGYDLVISSSHAVAKGVLTHSNQLHICYCYTPMRYAWDLHHHYLRETGLNKGMKGTIAKAVLHYLRLWDSASAIRPDNYIAISQYIADRIRKIYGREAPVIYPPVDIDAFAVRSSKEDFYLTASRLVPYKRTDLIVEAFARMPDKKLVVIGDGPDFKKIKTKVRANVELLGFQPHSVLKEYLQKAKAFVYAADEDFGIITVEAQACGTPVIALGKGGSLETVVEGTTGLFFREQSAAAIEAAIGSFEKRRDSFKSDIIRRNAERFSHDRFRQAFSAFIASALSSSPSSEP